MSALLPSALAVAVTSLLAALVWWLDRHGSEPLPRLVAAAALACVAGGVWGWGQRQSWFATWPRAELTAGGAVALAGDAAVLCLAGIVIGALLLAVGRSCLTEGPSSGALAGAACGGALALGWSAAAPLIGVVLRPGELPVRVTLLLLQVGAWTGLGVGFARLTLRWPYRALRVAGGLMVAVAGCVAALAALSCDAAAAGRPWCAVAIMTALAVLAALAVPAGFRIEGRIVARQLAEEVSYGVVPPELAKVAVSPLRRASRRWWPRRDERRAVSRLLVDLAFWKQRLVGLDEDRSRLYGLEVGRLRQRVRRLLDPDDTGAGSDAT